MRHVIPIGIAAALVLLAGCEPAEQEAALQGDVVAEDATEEIAPTPASGMTTPALRVDTLEDVGPYLTDAEGRALYLLEQDPQGQSTCDDRCADIWPPLLAPQGQPTAGAPGVQATLIGTMQRTDGSTQVTYGGKPLYHYSRDAGPGTATGQDAHDQFGHWYLVRPSGGSLEEHEDESDS